jgi:hypothetical protein
LARGSLDPNIAIYSAVPKQTLRTTLTRRKKATPYNSIKPYRQLLHDSLQSSNLGMPILGPFFLIFALIFFFSRGYRADAIRQIAISGLACATNLSALKSSRH